MRQKIDARHRCGSSRRAHASVTLLVLMTAMSFAHAAPSGGEVTAGSGAITQAGSAVTIDQSSARLAINWQSFDIASHESVTFNQPSSQAIALNRILGQDPSTILGNLSANGQVFLLNPNGVLFGAGAQVDVGGIVASTLALSNDDFLAGRYTFAGDSSSAGVVNRGTVEAAQGGYVAFIGPTVSNEGVIRANGGTVAPRRRQPGDPEPRRQPAGRLQRRQSGTRGARRKSPVDSGRRRNGDLSAQAKDALVSSVVNNDGVIEAHSVSNRDGVIRLEGGDAGVVSVAGTLDASGTGVAEMGGRITVSGDKVALLDGARLDASGSSGGGSVRVGGGYQGSDSDMRNAERTFVGQSAEIRADALDVGNGGRVVVWADGDTRFRGALSATGGVAGGNGGFVEVSGKQQLGFDGSVDTSARNGAVGTLLLDPNDLYIAAAPVVGANPDSTNPFQSNDGINDYYVLGSTLTALPANTAVQLQANRDIIFQTSLAMPTTAAGSLTFNALNVIQMNGFDLSTAGGAVSMTGANGIANLGTINLGAGALTLNSSGAIGQNAGDVIAGSGALIKQGTGTLTLSRANTYSGVTTVSAGSVSVTNAAGLGATTAGTTVASGATLSLDNVAIGTEGLTINGAGVGGNGALIGSGTAASSGTVAMGSASTIGVAAGTDQLTLLGVVGGGFALTKIGAGTLISSGSNTYTGGTVVSGGTLAVTANNALGTTAGGTTIASGATLDLRNVTYGTAETLTVNGGTIATSTGTSSFAGNVVLGANSTVNVAGSQLTLSGVVSGANRGIDKQNAGTLVLAGANTYSGATNINGGTLRASATNRIADASAVTVASGAVFDLNNFSDTIGSLAGAGNVTLGSATLTAGGNGTSTTYSGVVSGTGGLAKAGAGAMTLSGANTYTGTTAINAGTLRAVGRQRDRRHIGGDVGERGRCIARSGQRRSDRQPQHRRRNRRQHHVEREHAHRERSRYHDVCGRDQRNRRPDQAGRGRADAVRRQRLQRTNPCQRRDVGCGCEQRIRGFDQPRRERRRAVARHAKRHGGRRAVALRFDHRHQRCTDVDERLRPPVRNRYGDASRNGRAEQVHWGDGVAVRGQYLFWCNQHQCRHAAPRRRGTNRRHQRNDGGRRRDVRSQQLRRNGRIDRRRRCDHSGFGNVDGGRQRHVDDILRRDQRHRWRHQSRCRRDDAERREHVHRRHNHQRWHAARVRRQRYRRRIAGDVREHGRRVARPRERRSDRQPDRRRYDRRQRHVERQHAHRERGRHDDLRGRHERNGRSDQTGRRLADAFRPEYLHRRHRA